MKSKKIKSLVILALVAGIAAGGYYFFFSGGTEQIQLETIIVKKGSVSTIVTATGTVETTNQVDVGTQVSGVVKKIYVDYNSYVTAGQLIAELDKENLIEQLTQARSAYNVALNEQNYLQTVFDRQHRLYNTDAISEADYQEALYKLNTAKGTVQQKYSEIKRAETNLGFANIYSPINGVVLSRDVNEGQTVAASYSTPTLFTIAEDLKQMQVEANVDEADIGNVKEGQRVVFTVDAFPDEEFSGAVTQVRLNPTITSNVVTYTVIVKADNPEEKLKPGLTATISIYTMELNDVLTLEAKAFSFQPDMELLMSYHKQKGITPVPPKRTGQRKDENSSIQQDETKRTVWIKKEETLTPLVVTIGKNNSVDYEITEGLKEGDEIATSLISVQTAGKSTGSESGSSPFMPKPPGRR